MRNLWSELAIMLMAVVFASPLRAGDYVDPYKDYDEFVFMDYTLEQNITTPRVGKNEHRAVRDYMARIKDRLRERYTIDLTRNDEVIIISLPSDELFLPNDTLLTAYGERLLKPILPLFEDPMMYKMLYTVNTDNSGSVSYLENLSEARSNTLYSWLLEAGRVPEDQIIVPIPMADSDPLMPNDSRSSRAANRRIDLYLIPGPRMIQLAHEGKLH